LIIAGYLLPGAPGLFGQSQMEKNTAPSADFKKADAHLNAVSNGKTSNLNGEATW
jgi:hypothetical protein